MTKKIINLVWYPNFYTESSQDYYLDFNDIFWDFIFSDQIFNYLKLNWFKNLDKSDINNLKYILKNIKLAKNIFILFREKNIEVYHLFFAFNIINTYLEIINKNLDYEKILFYDYFKYNNINESNLDKTFIYYFLNENIKNIDFSWDIYLKINLSEQIIQLEVILKYLSSFKDNYNFNINLKWLAWFENKVVFRKKIEKLWLKYTNIKLSFLDFNVWVDVYFFQKILWKYNLKKNIFNYGCHYRKCNFCNIWKYLSEIDKNNQNKVLDKIISLHKDWKLDVLHITDPDILLEEILYVSDIFIKNNCDIKISIKMRFSKELTYEKLKKMYDGGVRFLWVWLESASSRLNKLMNKYDEDITIKDFDLFIENCFKAWINLHLYTIFWFPTEKREEIDLTNNFLIENFKKYNFFSYTAWLFWLNKGSYIYNNPKEFNLKFEESNIWDETFIKSFYEENIEKNKFYLIKVINNLKNILFFKNWFLFNKSREFWYFMEHSNLFHIYKLLFSYNPFIEFWNKNKSDNIYDEYYTINQYLQYVDIKNGEYLIVNWLNLEKILITKDEKNFIENYNNKLNLKDNLKDNYINNDNIKLFIKKYFLIKQ